MHLTNLSKITEKKLRRLGRGHGSGRGKTSGRGTKGQNARSSRALSFEGGALPLIKRLPFMRGKNKNKVFKVKTCGINVKYLNILPANSVVDAKLLAKHHIITNEVASLYPIKILGEGELSVPLTVLIAASKGAQAKIEKAGGKVEVAQQKK